MGQQVHKLAQGDQCDTKAIMTNVLLEGCARLNDEPIQQLTHLATRMTLISWRSSAIVLGSLRNHGRPPWILRCANGSASRNITEAPTFCAGESRPQLRKLGSLLEAQFGPTHTLSVGAEVIKFILAITGALENNIGAGSFVVLVVARAFLRSYVISAQTICS